MEKEFSNLEFFSTEKNAWTPCSIIGTFGEKSFIVSTKSSSSQAVVPIENIRQITKESENEFLSSQCEYEITRHFYVQCSIKSKKGKFLSLSLSSSNYSTLLSRESQIRYITSIDLSSLIASKFSNIVLSIPEELISMNWTSSESYEEMMKSINEGNEISMFSNLYPEKTPKNIRILCHKDRSELIKLIIDTAIENELKLCHITKDKSKTLKQIEDVQKKNKIFLVNKKFLGMLIGTQGSNVKNMKRKYNVNININSKYQNENNEAQVTISGDNVDNVEQCAIEMKIVEKNYEIKPGQDYNLKKMSSKYINQYFLKTFFVRNKDYQDENGVWYRAPNLNIIGPEEYINDLYKEIKYYISFK